QDMHNSGALLLALSLGRPVLVPRSAVTSALAAEVGADWVRTYPADEGTGEGAARGAGLTPDDVREALKTVRERAATSRPDLSRRRWPRIAREHAEVYRRAVSRRRRRPSGPAAAPEPARPRRRRRRGSRWDRPSPTWPLPGSWGSAPSAARPPEARRL